MFGIIGKQLLTLIFESRYVWDSWTAIIDAVCVSLAMFGILGKQVLTLNFESRYVWDSWKAIIDSLVVFGVLGKHFVTIFPN